MRKIRAMGSFLATFWDFALRMAGEIVFLIDSVSLMRYKRHFPTGKKLLKWGCFCLFVEFFGIPRVNTGAGRCKFKVSGSKFKVGEVAG